MKLTKVMHNPVLRDSITTLLINQSVVNTVVTNVLVHDFNV